MTRPRILLADEPTGNLGSRSGDEVMALFQELNRGGNTIILITHSEDIAKHCKRLIRMLDGHVIEDAAVAGQVEAKPVGRAAAQVEVSAQ